MRQRARITTECNFCGKSFEALKYDYEHGNGKFCSLSCSVKYKHKIANQSEENNPNWKEGISKNNYHYKKIQKERYPEKIKARELVSRAIKSGKLTKQNCVICGDHNSHAHHEDYSKPLEVIWLCKKHHDEKHVRDTI